MTSAFESLAAAIPAESAKAAGLRYTTDASPGIRRFTSRKAIPAT